MIDPSISSLRSIPAEYLFYGCGALLLLGIVLGITKVITVYSSYVDVLRCFMLVAAGIVTTVLYGEGASKPIWGAGLLVSLLLFVMVAVQTFRDNSNPISAVLALLVKIPVGTLYALLLLNVIAPAGRGRERQRTRQQSLLDFLLLTILIRALIVPREEGDDKLPSSISARLPR